MPHCLTFPNIAGTVGNTPLVRLNRVIPEEHATVLLKLEFFNPLSSVKDRIGRAMIEAAEGDGQIKPGKTHIIEPTSGNTGIALAFIAASRGYKLTLTMPESMSHERRALLRALGANPELTPAPLGMRGAIQRSRELLEKTPDSWAPQQFDNPANPRIHEETTGPEIWADTGGNVDVLVAGVGTGGTITGATRFLRTKNPDLASVAVEPAESPVISGGEPGPHRIQGIGAGFVPANLDRDLLDDVERVSAKEAFYWARRLAQEEGLLVGISTGANLAAAARIAAEPENRNKTIVTFACSSGERYLTTPLFDLIGKQLIDAEPDDHAEVRI
ncbi:MAG: cysteine synthase A [Phycisphaeraceae bacterium]|nr:cysteine synthase A [Phycisphaeraceae bacterium]